MDVQQIIALVVVATALVYLGRQFVVSAKAFFANKSGCASGCGKCEFAQERGAGKKTNGKIIGSSAPGNVIALGEIKTLPRRDKS